MIFVREIAKIDKLINCRNHKFVFFQIMSYSAIKLLFDQISPALSTIIFCTKLRKKVTSFIYIDYHLYHLLRITELAILLQGEKLHGTES